MENSIFFMWWFDVMQMSTENPNVLTNRATQYPHSVCPLVSVDQTTPTSKPISIWSPFSQKMLHFEHVDYEGEYILESSNTLVHTWIDSADP